MLSKLKKHSVLFALFAAIIVITAMGATVYAKKDLGMFYLKDLQGSRDAIEDAVISGDLSDGYHRTTFRIEKGQVKTQTILFEQPQRKIWNRYIPGRAKIMNGLEYEIMNGGPNFEVIARKRLEYNQIPIGKATVNPHVKYIRSDQNDNGNTRTYTNALEYGLAKIGEKVYFTLPTTRDYTGENGIYELKFSDSREYRGITGDSEQDARTVATISLDKNKADSHSSIEVLGLEAVGNNLALILVVDNELIIRSYDSESGKQLGEVIVPSFFLAGRSVVDSSINLNGESHNENYEAFSDHDQDILNLSFSRYSAQLADTGSINRTIISIDFSHGLQIIETIEASFTDGEEDYYNGLTFISHRNGKLYVVKTLTTKEEESSQFQYDIVRPKRFMVYVYEASTMIYKGELITDINDDNIRAINLPPQYGGFGYDESEYRNFNNLRIK